MKDIEVHAHLSNCLKVNASVGNIKEIPVGPDVYTGSHSITVSDDMTLPTSGKLMESDLELIFDHTIEDALISDGIEVEKYVNDRVTVVTQYAFAETSIKKVYLPNCTTIRRYGFYGNGVSLLEEFHGPKVISTTNTSFNGNKNLKVLDLNTFTSEAMNGCTALDTLILRKTSVVTIGATSLNGTPLASDGAGGYVYVPQSLLASYRSNASWQQWAHVLEFRPIEGSEYELEE